jgi:hypothetical protein
MLITEPALLCIRAIWSSLGRTTTPIEVPRQVVSADTAIRPARPLPPIPTLSAAQPIATDVQKEPPAEPVAVTQSVPGGPLTVRERRARAAALRALALSRTRRFSGAREAFIEASTLDPQLDLTRIPMFWTLERAAHEAAIDAYQLTGREVEATVLRAQVRTTYRPKSVPGPHRAPAAST